MTAARRILLATIAAIVLTGLAAPAAFAAFSLVRTWGNTVDREGSKVPGQFGTGRPTKAEGGDRQFDDPGGIAIEPNGNLLVSDPSNHRVNRYDANGKFLGSFGRHGFDPGATKLAGAGRMNLPEGLATDGKGKVFIADNRNDRVLVHTTGGRFVKRLARRGSSRGRTTSPWGMAINRTTLYVADQGNFRILRFTTGGRSLGSFGHFSIAGAGFVTPYGIAIDPRGTVYVTDATTDRVLKYGLTGAFKGQFGASGNAEGQFDRPTGVAVDPRGDVYVSDYCNQRIAHFGPGGSPLIEYIGADSVEAPTFLAFGRNANLYVADNHRMMQFAPAVTALAAKQPPVARASHRLGSGFC